MVQGTASHVGKSVIATALCRVLREEGFSVAPFKAQNMSLNAAVTPDGSEIGRAQAAQADAAGILPRAEMNPILLKPEGEARSQLVVMGRVAGSVAAREYWSRRSELWPVVAGALRELRREHEVVVIEGAGSPAEVNLRHSDISNMRVARAARAAVLLVGDIERGGVFAQLVGTLALLSPGDRARVRGLIVNKFRGDASLFDEGVRWLRRRSGLPVLGVLPYTDELGVPAEDSLSLDARGPASATDSPDIAVLRYPRISNFDDFEPLAAAGARVRYVRSAATLGEPDLVVLPGSKSTIADLGWLRRSGLAGAVRALAARGVPVLGICGGYQMLGRELVDALGVEGAPSRVRGLGLLPVRTAFSREKRTVRVHGRITAGSQVAPAGSPLGGYELHTGDTRGAGTPPFASLVREGTGETVSDGAVSADGAIVGTYVHGLFGDGAIVAGLLSRLAARRGIAFTPRPAPADRYAPLSAWFRGAIDVPGLLALTGIRGG